MKKCPFCIAEIPDEALKCRHCGEWVEKKPEPAPAPVPPVSPPRTGPSFFQRAGPWLGAVGGAGAVIFLGAFFTAACTQIGLDNPAVGWGMVVGGIFGVWLTLRIAGQNDPLGNPRLYFVAHPGPLIVLGCAVLAAVLVGVPLKVIDVWPRIPLWCQIIAVVLVLVAGGIGLSAGLNTRQRDEAVKAGAALGTGCLVLAAFALSLLITGIFLIIDDDSERNRERRDQVWSLDHPPIFWVLAGAGAIGAAASLWGAVMQRAAQK